MILILAKVLSVFGNIKVYDPSFVVPVVIFVVLTKFVTEYSNKMEVGLRFASVHEFQVMLYTSGSPLRYVVVVGAVMLIPAGFVLSKINALVTPIVHVLPTKSVIKILKLINHSRSVFFITKAPE